MRLDGMEIKVSFADKQTLKAVKKLELPDPPAAWQIYFCEDVSPGASVTPLLDIDVIIRARVRPDDRDDVTVKLRPCRSSQFTDRWLDSTSLKIEADWAGGRRVLAASYTEVTEKSVIPAVVARQRPFTDLFSRPQLEFLADCGLSRINLDTLTVLPSITAVRWGKKVTVGPDDLGLRAERWTLDDLDFLELSAVVETEKGAAKAVEDALDKQNAILDYLNSLGLGVAEDQESKTSRVMAHLVRSSRLTL